MEPVSVSAGGRATQGTGGPRVAIGQGSLSAEGRGKALFAQSSSHGHIRASAALRVPEDWWRFEGLDMDDAAAVRERLLTMFPGWDESLRALLRDSDHGFVDRPLYALPVPHSWQHIPGVTLLGDAAHLMPPLGVGANLATLEGTELAAFLAGAAGIDDAVRAYESAILPRAAEAAKECAEGLETLLPPVGGE